jgi:large subunit ribosomal protein L30
MSETQPVKKGKVRITQIRSAIGETERHKATIRALGLHRLHETVEHDDSPALRGMLYLVDKLVRVERSE